MRIAHNISALNAYNKTVQNSKNVNGSLAKLSSGLRINQAADDSSGLAISEKMRGQIRGLGQAEQNIQHGLSLVQTAEAGLGEISDPHLLRMRELAIQAANDTLTDADRQQIQLEIDQLKGGINHIANHTEFNTIKLLNRTSNEVAGSSGITIINGSEIALTSTTDYDTQPSWQVEKIAFNRGENIFIMNADGSDQKLLISGASQPAISPDATKVAYTRNDSNLYIANIDGTGEIQLTTSANVNYDQTFGSRLTWSPDNEVIYFKSSHGIESYSLNNSTRSVVVADASASSPSITPDGNRIVFQKTGGIYSMNVDGTDEIYLSTTGSEPRLSPDGKLIAYSAPSADTNDDELFIMNIDGTGKTDITGKMDTAALHAHNIFPEWSPDGKYIIFHSDNVADPSTSGDIWRVELNGVANANPDNTSGFTLFFQVGANTGQNLAVALTDARTTAIGIDHVSVLSREDAEKAITAIDVASQKISSERSRFGVYQNVLEHISMNVSNYRENILSSESRIRDIDIAGETTKLANSQIILQSAQAMMAQANQVTQGILQMLR